ncbi:MAG: hypothetical protein PHU40_10810 [Sulfurimonas sp.]|nr:hypothetical protein [Sulfurimonas sp.]
MRVVAILLGLTAVVFIGLYTLAFTSLGNSIMEPIIESKIRQETKLESKLTTFSLNMSSLEIVLELTPNNRVSLDGNYSLFSQVFTINYEAKLDQLSDLNELAGAPLIGNFSAQGHIQGDMDLMDIDGVSDIAKSQTSYHVTLTDMQATSIIAKVQKADLLTLLGMLGQKPYASAQIDLDIDFKNITPHALDGVVTLQTHKGKIDAKLMQSDFNVSLPETAFSLNLDAQLSGDDVDYTARLDSNLAKIISSGKVIPEPLALDVIYVLDIQELAVLKPITQVNIRGPLRLNGTAKGNKENLLIDGKSDFSGSDTAFTLNLEEFAPRSIKANMKNLKLEKVLYMLEMPHYADGVLWLDADITDARSTKLKGNITTSIKNGLVDSKYVTKTYEFKSEMPRTAFDLKTTTLLNAEMIDTQVTLNTTLASIVMQKLRFDMRDASLDTDYKLSVPNLDALFFATQRHIRGGLVADGKFSQAKDMDLTVHSNIASGTLEAKLHNDDFRAELKGLKTQSILHMLLYPEIFDSSLNGTFVYNLLAQKGELNAALANGVFSKNEIFSLIKQYGVLDMYEERFKGDVNAKINKEFIVASLELLSNKSSIKTQNTKLNSKTKAIDSNLDLVVNNNPISASIRGTTDAPKVSVDLEKFMKSKAGDAVKQEVNKFLKGFF